MKSRLAPALLAAAVLLLAAGCNYIAGMGAPAGAPASTDANVVDVPGTDVPGTDVPGTDVHGVAGAPSGSENGSIPEDYADYALALRTVYFPEGAGEEDAQYILSYTLPVFADDHDGLNAAIALYEEELTERVREERLPFADRVEGDPAPRTDVTAEASYTFTGGARRIWSIRLFETVSYGGDAGQETIPYSLVLDDAGNELSFASVSGQYEPDALVAQQVFNAIDQTPDSYYADLTPEDVRLALDLMNGFAVTESGYDVFISPGVVAPAERGVCTFPIPRAALYPDCVGDALSVSEYEALLPAFNALAAACAPNYEGFFDGSPSAYAASAFLTCLLTTGDEDAAWVDVPAADYEAAFADYFTGALPADIVSWGDGTAFENGVYRLPVRPRAAYALRVDDAVREADSITVYGMLLYGVPGTEEAGELAALVITLAADGDAPAGFRFVSVELT